MGVGQLYRLVPIVPVADVSHFHVADICLRDRCRVMVSAFIASVRGSVVLSCLSNRMVLGYRGPPAGVAAYNYSFGASSSAVLRFEGS